MMNPICREKMEAQAVWLQGHNFYSQRATRRPHGEHALGCGAACACPAEPMTTGLAPRHGPGPAHATPVSR